jgi:hypothetical protein
MIVYLHKKITDNEVFYVGIGSKRRAYSKSSRNKHWKSFVSNHDYYVDITHNNLIREDACSIEKYLIEFYRLNSKCKLTNKTNGGDGADRESSLLMNKIRWDNDVNGGRNRLVNYNKDQKSKKVFKISLDGKLIEQYSSAREAARQNNMSQATISKCCLGRYKTSNKHKWQYFY